jgi:hypothetical protein
MSELPPGFVLDQPAASALPPGFVLDSGPSLAEDAAKSVGAGLGNAAIGTLGAVGDVRSLLSAGVDAASSRLGVDPSMLKRAAGFAFPAMNSAPTSQDIRSTVTDPIVSPDYQPQTATGGALKTGAEFLPAMVGGPESLAAKFATRVAVPALATEAAGSLTKGTAAEPYARVAGALAGGVGASKVANSMAEARALKMATPALADVKSEATSAYDALTARNVATPLAQSTLDNLAGDITTTLNNRGIRPSNAASIHQAVSEIKTPATAGAADVVDLVAARQSIKELLGKHDTNKSGAFVALGKIEQAIEQNSPGTMKAIREADKNYASAKAAEALDKRVAKAELRAAGENSGMNVGNKIRQNVATYLGSNEAKYLSAETKADLEKIVRGTASQNTMRAVANLLGGGGGLGMLAGGTAGYQAGGWGGAAAGAAAGRAFKSLNNRSVMKQAEQAGRNIRSRSPLGQQNPPLLLPMTNPLLGGLLPALLARPKQ